MAETLRDLVVNLSLNSNNFNANMRMINKQMKEADSAFKLAGAGIENFESKTAGLQAKTALLQNKQNLLNKSLEQYRKQVTALDKKLGDQYRDYTKYTDRLAEQEAAYKALGNQIKEYNRILASGIDYSSPFGQSLAADMQRELADMNIEYSRMGTEVSKTKGQIDALGRSMRNTETSIAGTKAGLNSVEAELKECNKELKIAESSWSSFATHAQTVSNTLLSIGGQLSSFGGFLTRGLTVPLVAAGAVAANSTVDFEDALAGVRKTVVGTAEDYERLASAARSLSLDVPVDSATEILAVYEAAGQLGIATEAVEGFGEAMAYMGEIASDVSAVDAAESLARFVNITGLEQTNENFWRLSNTIYHLANSMATTESEVITLATRLAGAGRQVGLTDSEIVAFAAALSSVGIEAEAGGTAFSKAMTKIEVAVAEGGDALADFARVAGMSEEDFVSIWETDPAQGLMAFIVGLSRMSEEGISAISTLNDLELSEVRLRDTLLRATNAHELFASALDQGNAAWEENNALTKAASDRFNTTANRFKRFKNNMTDLAMEFGEVLLPHLEEVLGKVDGWVDGFKDLDAGTRSNIVSLAMYAAAAGPVLKVLGGITSGVGKAAHAMSTFATWMAKGSTGAQLLANAGSAAGKALGAAGVAAAAIAGAVALERFVSGAAAAEEALDGMQATADSWNQNTSNSFYHAAGGLSTFGLSESDFTHARTTMQGWVDELNEVWTDGAPESDEIVTKYSTGFRSLAENTISSLEELRASADEGGIGSLTTEIDGDIAELEAMADEVDALLKKRQNGYLTEAEQARLQELVDKRDAIIIRYQLQPDTGGGYEEIISQVEGAQRRAALTGSEVAQSTYEEAAKAAGEGYAAVNAELDAQYDKQVEIASLLTDEGEREKALAEADEQYLQSRRAAAEEYAAALSQITPELVNSDEFAETEATLARLAELMAEYSTADGKRQSEILAEANALTEGLDEGSLVDYLGVLTQVQSLLDSGMEWSDIESYFPDLAGYDEKLEQYSGISAWVEARKEELGGLNEMLNEAVPDELKQVAIDLDLTQAQARWEQFKTDASVITTGAIIEGYSESPEAAVQRKTATRLAATIGVTTIERNAVDEWLSQNPDFGEVDGVIRVRTLSMSPEALMSARAQVVDLSNGGLPVPITPQVAEKLTGDELVVTDENGQITVFVNPKWSVEQSPEDLTNNLSEAAAGLSAPDKTITGSVFGKEFEVEVPVSWQFAVPDWSSEDTFSSLDRTLQDGFKAWNPATWFRSDQNLANEYVDNMTRAEDWADATQFVLDFWAAVNGGGEVSTENLASFNTILGVLEKLSEYGAGSNERANLAESLSVAGLDTSADTLAKDLRGIYDQAVLAGENVSKGLADGVEQGGGDAADMVAAEANSMITAAESTLDEHSPSRVFHRIGLNAMLGMANGVNSGASSVVSAVRRAALNAVAAAKAALQIHSPSKVFQTEVGEMIMAGIGAGITDGIPAQSRLIANASRNLTASAQSAVGGVTSYDNHQTYNQQSSATVNIEKYVANDQQDVYALAVETAALIRRKQRGRGKM